MKKGKGKMYTLIIIFVLVLICGISIFFFAPKPPATPKEAQNIQEMESHFEDLVQSGYPAAFSVVVVKNGETVYNNAFGMADAPKNIKATVDSVYHWWSTTKIYTAVAIMQLSENGLLDLDDPVKDYLPFFEVKDPFNSRQEITIRHLLNHSSGLPDNVPAVVGWMHFENQEPFDQTELLKRVLPSYSKLQSEVGTKSSYTNVGYMVLGSVIETITGETYEDYIRANILQPLQMDQTDFVYTDEMKLNAATGMHPVVELTSVFLPFLYWGRLSQLVREINNGQMWLNPVLANSNPPTGLIGPAGDMARFVTAFLNGGELDGVRILSQQSVETMTYESRLPIDDAQTDTNVQGLGWEILDDGENLCLMHGGGGAGFGSVIALYPNRSLGIIIISNYTGIDRVGLVELIASLDW